MSYGGGKYVAIHAETALNNFSYSVDGINWTLGASSYPDTALQSITYGNDKFVVTSGSESNSSDKSYYSTNGINWSQSTLPSIKSWMSVTFGNGRYVSVSRSNIAAYSNDGINWTQSSLPSISNWDSVTFGNNIFVAVSSSASISAYSYDGIIWKQLAAPHPSNSITFGDGRFVSIRRNSNQVLYSNIIL